MAAICMTNFRERSLKMPHITPTGEKIERFERALEELIYLLPKPGVLRVILRRTDNLRKGRPC